MVSRNMRKKGFSLRISTLFLLCWHLVWNLPFGAIADSAKPADHSQTAPRIARQSEAGLVLASTNEQFLVDVRQKPAASLSFCHGVCLRGAGQARPRCRARDAPGGKQGPCRADDVCGHARHLFSPC